MTLRPTLALLGLFGLLAVSLPATATPQGADGLIAFASTRDGDAEIFAMFQSGGGQTQLTNNGAIDISPSWSPDGTRIAFASNRTGSSQIHVMNADGSGQTNISNTAVDELSPAWSPDGSRIAFVSPRGGSWDLWTMAPDGSNPTNLTQDAAIDGSPAWAPDGSRIAWTSDAAGNDDIWVRTVPPALTFQLTNDPSDDYQPTWSSDGGRIAFVADRTGNADIWVRSADGTGSDVQLTTNPAYDNDPEWSPNGNRIAFTSFRDGNDEVYVMFTDGSAQAPLSGNPASDHSAAWQRPLDGATRLFGADRIATAVAVSQQTFPTAGPPGVGGIVLARSDAFPDALAGTPLAVRVIAPILLTRPDTLHPATRAEMQRLLAPGGTVYLLGGTAALSAQVEQQVQGLGYATTRLGGASRFATAVEIANFLGGPSPLFVATGGSFQAALVSGVAAGAVLGAVLLTADGQMPPETQSYLATHGAAQRYAVGPEAIQADPGAIPIGGVDASEVSRNLANTIFPPSPSTAGLASGTVFADGLTGGPYQANLGGPMLLTDPAALSQPVREYLFNHADPINQLFVYGGPAAIGDAVVEQASRAVTGLQ